MLVLAQAPGDVPTPIAYADADRQSNAYVHANADPNAITLWPGLTITQIGGSIVPGTTDTGNHGDDVVTNVPLPFSYSLYGQTFNSLNVSSNGNAQFTTTDAAFTNVCLPWSDHDYTIFPYWDDLRHGCRLARLRICTSVSGSAPNRIFNIEWRAAYFPDSSSGQLRVEII